MLTRYPEIEPYASGLLDVGDGNHVYWEASGNPAGKPALALHGGPGGGTTPGRRRSFDPQRYHFVQFDQRGCGRSTPSVSNPATTLAANTTAHLIADIEALREHLGIDRWLVWGGSWGCTLALAYAQRFPHRVSELVLVSVTMTRPADVHWLYHEAGRFFPDEWDRFRAGVPADQRDGNLIHAYDRLLNAQPDEDVRARAALDWCAWEDAVVSLEDGWAPNPRYADPAFRMTFARLCAHYFANAAWLDEGELLANAHRLAGIPGVLIHGRLDLGGPPDVPWLLARAWPDAELYLVGTGHAGGAEMTEQMMRALNRFATT
ncbi:prolyl aminopeptidase [Jatrophihabitans cynanchi]|uniref:Proline iminopeptidase n=1 Tax=Jatrophihabitans cynanchi TaxID=2944128 RepID=A0ABY7JTJ5_9ACTN|nr:prolyl aminopeptidase [Jatrophihabitans sp. SB3-54]WAX55355.1 prolyl aminopeptidase [Jatrophihabitans sp. SB3-54]